MTAIKLCGLTHPADIDAAVAAGATHAGFVLFPPSPRNVSFDRLTALSNQAAGRLARVAVMVDPDDTLIDRLIALGIIDAIQLHGKETPERVRTVAQRTGLSVWKAVSVESPADIATATQYRQAADLVLFDAKTPKGSALPGGMGVSFDWTMLADAPLSGEWGLSGGLTPENVGDALRITGAALVDVSSGIESAPGVKEVDKMVRFCQAVRHHDQG